MEETKIEVDVTVSEEEAARIVLSQLIESLPIPASKIKAAVTLLDEGNTIPFIARYRKEVTGELDEEQLRIIEEKLFYLRNLHTRKEEVIRLIEEQGKLTDELHQSILNASKLQEVEDLYRPYRQKRRTRASVAKEQGLEPFAEWILSQPSEGYVQNEAQQYVDAEKGIETTEQAIQGASDIIAEQISDSVDVRRWVRQFTFERGILITEVKDAEADSVYEMYYDYSEPLKTLPPHRILAINRGEREDVLRVKFEVPIERIYAEIGKQYIQGESITKEIMETLIEDAYKRLLAPSIERDVRGELTERAEEHAIQIFAENLRSLLLQAPVKGNVVMGVDPAFRTGCKVAVIDETGKLLHVEVTYPTPPANKVEEALAIFEQLVDKYGVEIIVVGNGTASRETEQFVADFIRRRSASGKSDLKYIIISEAGASVYSASKLAAEEFPTLDVAERSAISIARRLQDPLAELVKIDPRSIGVGQYQHDVGQKRLESSLQNVVESAVNHVGVDLNTASAALLSYVSGVNATTAKNIVKYREEHGKFIGRQQLQKVPRLGAKTFQQCVGFMRIAEGENPLDNTPIHPESYEVVDRLFKQLKIELDQLGTEELKQILDETQLETLAIQLDTGVPTLKDILESLVRPGRDPREELPPPIFHTEILELKDLKVGMELQGTVRNVIDFGAFVDIGITNDGLVHISQLADRYVKHPLDVVAVGDIVTVWVLNVDVEKGRIGLTMRRPKD